MLLMKKGELESFLFAFKEVLWMNAQKIQVIYIQRRSDGMKFVIILVHKRSGR